MFRSTSSNTMSMRLRIEVDGVALPMRDGGGNVLDEIFGEHGFTLDWYAGIRTGGKVVVDCHPHPQRRITPEMRSQVEICEGTILCDYTNELLKDWVLELRVIVRSRIAVRLEIFSGLVPMFEYSPREKEMALKQQAIARSLHSRLHARSTFACIFGDFDRRDPWFRFSEKEWREISPADLLDEGELQ